MTSGPTTTNSTATTLNTIVDDSVKAAEGVAITAEEAALDAAVPFFAAPVIAQITDEVLTLGTDYIGNALSVAIQKTQTVIVIDLQVAGEESGLSQALLNLIDAEKSGNQVAIQAAITAYQEDQSALQNDDGSAPVST